MNCIRHLQCCLFLKVYSKKWILSLCMRSLALVIFAVSLTFSRDKIQNLIAKYHVSSQFLLFASVVLFIIFVACLIASNVNALQKSKKWLFVIVGFKWFDFILLLFTRTFFNSLFGTILLVAFINSTMQHRILIILVFWVLWLTSLGSAIAISYHMHGNRDNAQQKNHKTVSAFSLCTNQYTGYGLDVLKTAWREVPMIINFGVSLLALIFFTYFIVHLRFSFYGIVFMMHIMVWLIAAWTADIYKMQTPKIKLFRYFRWKKKDMLKHNIVFLLTIGAVCTLWLSVVFVFFNSSISFLLMLLAIGVVLTNYFALLFGINLLYLHSNDIETTSQSSLMIAFLFFLISIVPFVSYISLLFPYFQQKDMLHHSI